MSLSKKLALFSCLILGGSITTSQAFSQPEGLYGTSCLPLEKLSAVKDVLLDNGHFEMIQTIFSDDACQVPAYDFAFTGRYTLDEEQGFLDLTFEDISLTALDPRIASAFGESELCGISQWTHATPVVVNDLSCGGQKIPAREAVVYEIIRETAKGIELGSHSEPYSGDSPSQRPTSFEAVSYEAR